MCLDCAIDTGCHCNECGICGTEDLLCDNCGKRERGTFALDGSRKRKSPGRGMTLTNGGAGAKAWMYSEKGGEGK